MVVLLAVSLPPPAGQPDHSEAPAGPEAPTGASRLRLGWALETVVVSCRVWAPRPRGRRSDCREPLPLRPRGAGPRHRRGPPPCVRPLCQSTRGGEATPWRIGLWGGLMAHQTAWHITSGTLHARRVISRGRRHGGLLGRHLVTSFAPPPTRPWRGGMVSITVQRQGAIASGGASGVLKQPWANCCSDVCAHLGYPANSSSNALASWRSAVSKPSVNQP